MPETPLFMRLAVDTHNLLSDRRGIGVYVRAVLRRLLARDEVDASLVVRDLVPAFARNAVARELGTRRFHLVRGIPRVSEVAWHPWNGTFYASAVPSVVTIHDCAPFAFPARSERERLSQQDPFRRSAASARRIIADSHFSKSEIVKHLGVPEERIDVVYLAAGSLYAPGEPLELPEAVRGRPYVLYVGADDDRKNLRTLLEAWRSRGNDDVQLVCVTEANVPEATTLSGLSDERLRDLYRGALALAMPSRYEGFGLPPLEAMQSGCAVVASRASSLPEVCGDAAAYVDAVDDPRAWRAALDAIVADEALRARLRTAGFAQAARFSWDRCASETFAVFEAIRRP